MKDSPILQLHHVDTYYGKTQVLYDINIEIYKGNPPP